jgi:hypothetical protein
LLDHLSYLSSWEANADSWAVNVQEREEEVSANPRRPPIISEKNNHSFVKI